MAVKRPELHPGCQEQASDGRTRRAGLSPPSPPGPFVPFWWPVRATTAVCQGPTVGGQAGAKGPFDSTRARDLGALTRPFVESRRLSVCARLWQSFCSLLASHCQKMERSSVFYHWMVMRSLLFFLFLSVMMGSAYLPPTHIFCLL